MSEKAPARYGRVFYDPDVGYGRIEETPPVGSEPDANAVSRVMVRFYDVAALTDVDVSDVSHAAYDLGTFRRQIIHDDFMIDIIGRCVDRAISLSGA